MEGKVIEMVCKMAATTNITIIITLALIVSAALCLCRADSAIVQSCVFIAQDGCQ
jgi:hypothetical protein